MAAVLGNLGRGPAHDADPRTVLERPALGSLHAVLRAFFLLRPEGHMLLLFFPSLAALLPCTAVQILFLKPRPKCLSGECLSKHSLERKQCRSVSSNRRMALSHAIQTAGVLTRPQQCHIQTRISPYYTIVERFRLLSPSAGFDILCRSAAMASGSCSRSHWKPMNQVRVTPLVSRLQLLLSERFIVRCEQRRNGVLPKEAS